MYALEIMHKQTCAYICTENKVQTSAYLCAAPKNVQNCALTPDTGGEMPLQGLLVVSVFNSFDYLI
jgi:hypothetical protein